MVRTASPGDGSLTLVFADNPLALRQWSVIDAQRQETRVTPVRRQLGGTFDPDLFVFIARRPTPAGDQGRRQLAPAAVTSRRTNELHFVAIFAG